MPKSWDDFQHDYHTGPGQDPWAPQREAMVAEQVEARGIRAFRVLEAMRRVPRHRFMPPEEQEAAYADTALPIGHRQTISQPFIVGLMSELAEPHPGAKILEAGTGSGYQAAVLAEAGATVYTVEIVEPLARQAQQIFDQLHYDRVFSKIGDAFTGWLEAAPFDSIVMTFAAARVPPSLLQQLKPGGRLIAPLGEDRLYQTLTLVTKSGSGELHYQGITGVVFVPMTGPHGM